MESFRTPPAKPGRGSGGEPPSLGFIAALKISMIGIALVYFVRLSRSLDMSKNLHNFGEVYEDLLNTPSEIRSASDLSKLPNVQLSKLKRWEKEIFVWRYDLTRTKRSIFKRAKKEKKDKPNPKKTHKGSASASRPTNLPPVAVESILGLRANATHLLSRIPKAGAKYAHEELYKLLKATLALPGDRTIQDIKAAQSDFSKQHEDFFSVDSRPFDADPGGFAPPLICNAGGTPPDRLKPYFVQHAKKKLRLRCEMWMTELPRSELELGKNHAQVYTIVREPLSHVLSQYFHCTESPEHRKPTKLSNGTTVSDRHALMPPLEEWLAAYASIAEASSPTSVAATALTERFRCFNPLESESEFLAFPHREIPDGYTFPLGGATDSAKRDEATRKLDETLRNDLRSRFRIVGDTAQMVRTVCAIFIDFTQGKHVPKPCDCTHSEGDAENGRDTFLVTDRYRDPDGSRKINIEIGYIPDKHSSGVTHHGSSHLNEITPGQRELLGRLRKKDLVLYNVSRAVFEEQVTALETSYGIKICHKWNTGG